MWLRCDLTGNQLKLYKMINVIVIHFVHQKKGKKGKGKAY